MPLQVVHSICLSSMCSHHKIYRPSSNISHACALHARRGQEVSEIFYRCQPPKLVFHCHLSRMWRIKRCSCPVNQWTRERGGSGVGKGWQSRVSSPSPPSLTRASQDARRWLRRLETLQSKTFQRSWSLTCFTEPPGSCWPVVPSETARNFLMVKSDHTVGLSVYKISYHILNLSLTPSFLFFF